MFPTLVLNMNRDGTNAFLYRCRKTHTRHNKKITGVEITSSQQSKKHYELNHLEVSTNNPQKKLKAAVSIPDWVIGIFH